jgi:hypothetical protein
MIQIVEEVITYQQRVKLQVASDQGYNPRGIEVVADAFEYFESMC